MDTLINLSTISASRGQYDAAIEHLTKATMLDPFDYRVYYNMFVVYNRKEKYQIALSYFRKCLSLLYTMQIIYKLRLDPLPTLNRSIYFWPENTASYSLKTIYLILANQL